MEGSFFCVPAPYEQAFCLPDDTQTMGAGRQGARAGRQGEGEEGVSDV